MKHRYGLGIGLLLLLGLGGTALAQEVDDMASTMVKIPENLQSVVIGDDETDGITQVDVANINNCEGTFDPETHACLNVLDKQELEDSFEQSSLIDSQSFTTLFCSCAWSGIDYICSGNGAVDLPPFFGHLKC